VSEDAEYRAIHGAVLRKYWVLGRLLAVWGAIGKRFGSSAGEGAVAWTIDDTV
jgi:hypothetical protein